MSNYQNQVKPYKCDPFYLHNLHCILSTKHIYHQPQTVPLEVFRHPPCCWPMRNLASHVSNHLYALIPLQDCYNPCVYCWLVEKQHPLCSKQAFWRSRDTHCPLKPTTTQGGWGPPLHASHFMSSSLVGLVYISYDWKSSLFSHKKHNKVHQLLADNGIKSCIRRVLNALQAT